MKPFAIIGQSFRSIYSNKVRSSLTILGIVIGIAAVIALVSLGNGLKSNVTSNISNLGTKDLQIRSQDPERATAQREEGPGGQGPGGGERGGFTFGGGQTSTITQDDYADIKDNKNIELASVEMNRRFDVALTQDADEATAYSVYGIDGDYASIKDFSTTNGALLTQKQIDNSDASVILGEDAASTLFPDTNNPVGQTIYISDTAYVVAGVLATQESASPFDNPSQAIFMGYKSFLTLEESSATTDEQNTESSTSTGDFSTVVARATTEDTVDAAQDEIHATLLKNHSITDEDKADVAIQTSKDLLSTVSSVAESFTNTLAGIAAISLIVGGIGIMNIMLVTVTERTREIGLRRALGAKNRHILMQFLTESLLLTLIGGALGVVGGIIASQKASSLISFLPQRGPADTSDVQAVVSPSTLILAVVISVGIGIVFGLFPAWKASRLDPVEALRYE